MLESLEPRFLLTTFYAYNTADVVDGTTSPPVEQSLREAVLAANANGINDTIRLTNGNYTLSIPNSSDEQENAAAEGDLDLDDPGTSLLIEGAGAGTVIDAAQLDRVFQILPNTNVTLRRMTITGGLAQDNGSAGDEPGDSAGWGGGVLNNGGTLTLDRVWLEDNEARGNALGGGVYVGSSAGPTTILGSTIARNLAAGASSEGDFAGSWARGGGLYIGGTSAPLDVSGTTFDSNMAIAADGEGLDGNQFGGTARGGAIYVSSSPISAIQSSFENNSATGGTGVGSEPSPGNGGRAEGGAIYHGSSSPDADMFLRVTPFTNNTATGGDSIGGESFGGRGGDASGGAVYKRGGEVILSSAPLTNNIAAAGNGGNGFLSGGNGGNARGGGLYAGGDGAAADVFLITTNVTGNNAEGGDGGDGDFDPGNGGTAEGGGIYLGQGTLNLDRSPVSDNSAEAGDGGDGNLDLEPPESPEFAALPQKPANGFVSGGNGGNARGGGIYAGGINGGIGAPVVVTASRSAVTGNSALGGHSGVGLNEPDDDLIVFVAGGLKNGVGGGAFHGGNADGGGLWVGRGSLAMSISPVDDNRATAGDGFNGGGHAHGGGIYAGGLPNNGAPASASVSLDRSHVRANEATGGASAGEIIIEPLPASQAAGAKVVSEEHHHASGGGGGSWGGGVYLGQGELTVLRTNITDNLAQGGDAPLGPGGSVGGGGVYAGGGGGFAEIDLQFSTINDNTAQGGNGSSAAINGATQLTSKTVDEFFFEAGGQASGGGLWLGDGELTSFRSNANGNTAAGGDALPGVLDLEGVAGFINGFGGSGGSAFGGGMYLGGGFGAEVLATFELSFIRDNTAIGGDGHGGFDSHGGNAVGGGIYAGGLGGATGLGFNRSAVENNLAQGGLGGDASLFGPGGHGGNAAGGGIWLGFGVLLADDTDFRNNTANGGDGGGGGSEDTGGAGGDAVGGGLYLGGTDPKTELELQAIALIGNGVISGNRASGGNGGAAGSDTSSHGGSGGNAAGGGVHAGSTELLLFETDVLDNESVGGNGGAATNGGDGGTAIGGGLHLISSLLQLEDSEVRDNSATGGNGGDGDPTSGSGGNGGDARGGGVHHDCLSEIIFIGVASIVDNTILAGLGGLGAILGLDGVAEGPDIFEDPDCDC